MLRKKKAQSILEYVIILTAVVGAIIAIVAATIGKRSDQSGVGRLMHRAGDKIQEESGRIADMTK